MSLEAPRVWRAHHNGGLQFQAEVKKAEQGGYWLVLPWTGKRIEITTDVEEMRGRLRGVGFNEMAVERLTAWLFGIPAEAPIATAEVIQSFVELKGGKVGK